MQDAELPNAINGHSLHIVNVFGSYIKVLSDLFSFNLDSTASYDTTILINPADAYLCTAFVKHGIIPSAPITLTLGFKVQVLELFRVAHLRSPHFSQQAFVKTLSDLRGVSHILLESQLMLTVMFRCNIESPYLASSL